MWSYCDERIKWPLCKPEEHLAVDCPGNWSRQTRLQRSPRRVEESRDIVAGEEAEDSRSMEAENNIAQEMTDAESGADSDDVEFEALQAEESQSDDAAEGLEVSNSIAYIARR